MVSMVDQSKSDEKIIAVRVNDPSCEDYKDISEMPEHIFEEMKHFFQVYKNLEGKITSVDEISGAQKAKETIAKCMSKFEEVNGKEPTNI